MSVEYVLQLYLSFFFFFFNDTATTEIYTLSLHDALPISGFVGDVGQVHAALDAFAFPSEFEGLGTALQAAIDRKSTRLNSSHSQISYAVFCLKKKKNTNIQEDQQTIPQHT